MKINELLKLYEMLSFCLGYFKNKEDVDEEFVDIADCFHYVKEELDRMLKKENIS